MLERCVGFVMLVLVCASAGCGGRVVARDLTGLPVASVRPARVGIVVVRPSVPWAWLAALAAWIDAYDNPPSPGFTSWECVSVAETTDTDTAHGSQYSSEFGMLNQAVRERADSPESAARIMAGTASGGEQRRAAARELAVFGPGAWGLLTRQKCAT